MFFVMIFIYFFVSPSRGTGCHRGSRLWGACRWSWPTAAHLLVVGGGEPTVPRICIDRKLLCVELMLARFVVCIEWSCGSSEWLIDRVLYASILRSFA